ncbi:MAG: serine/threonine protein kinase, partial [Acidobacteriaceae bacterium]|nr:serine/threonine protein kinase [Acidobacteriaceae bacterium]
MARLREEITKTFLRWASPAPKPPPESPPPADETVIQPGSRVGQQIGAYTILRRLGFGGMGHVYLAQDTRLGRLVALKLLPPELGADHGLLFRLEQEAQTASALNHPNILTIYEMGESNGEHFIATEYVDGLTLRAFMEREPLDGGTAIDIASQVASALIAAHGAGIVHRDLKPGNIMIRNDGYVKVIDFGIAKYIEETNWHHPAVRDTPTPAGVTRTGAVVGTVAYMSPEQARGDHVDHRADLWSLGVILYEMLTHRRPFAGVTETALVVAIQRDPPAPLPDTKPLPRGLQPILNCALSKDPARRYQSAAEMLAELHHVTQASGLGSRIRPIVVARRPQNPRAKWLAAAAVALAIISVAAIWWWPLGGKTRVLGPHWFRIAAVRQVTFNARTTLSALSPDGNYLAFVVGDPGGQQSLYLKQIDS